MLSSLRIQNIAIAENLEIELAPGLNILTGETGAGKSIILKSIELLTGKKAQANLIRSNQDKAIIEGLFTLNKETINDLVTLFPEVEDILEEDENEVLIRRILDKSGRSKFYINGALFNQGTVSRISAHLIEITGQHDQNNLREVSHHRSILDEFAKNSELLKKVRAAFLAYKEKKDFLEKLNNSKEEILFKLEKLKFEATELKKIALTQGERERLEMELEKVKHFDKSKTNLEEALSLLEGRSDKGQLSLYNALSKVYNLLSPLSKVDSEINNLLETAQQSLTCIGELSSQTEEALANLDYDPKEFEKKLSRVGDIKQVERKYRKSADELVEYLPKIEQEISQLEGNSLDEKKIEIELTQLKNQLSVLENELTISRTKSAKKLTQYVIADLKELSLNKARFEVEINPGESSSHGADKIIFKFSANPGEPLHPLEQVASGGELSRVQLILKSLSGTNTHRNLLVFDEIDSGVSGAVSQSVGEKLVRLSKSSQVIAITHSAQIAAMADKHILVEKEVINERTYSKVSYLSDKKRVEVIASILAGKNISEDFRKSAERLLEIRQEKVKSV